ncbi:efflux RND transporter permease subunit [Thalassotalea sp. 1_MG-2023]|uniref:efflux RND transporter permease subunit n=1 Tax=Thalassotalea sp. 1_MG-2023 TaxID=3062680 RepID=UPI0026E40655|nr:efflux RND transporter permease subunit [Thalassotalea sp. 1_MG-2023]MDO6426273.1 efflux RND transporter permease subunit [Thalassotalea sp. 1_MG-2023]
MLTIIDGALTRTRSVLLIFILLLISGAVTYSNIAKESNPDITIPMIYVSMIHDGISPEDAERMLVRPMEKELKSIAGIKEMTAVASEGHASITLEFLAGLDPKEALADVRDKVTLAKAKLPSETEEPEVHEVTMANQVPAVTVILSGPVTERGLLTLARDLKDDIEGMKEVLEVDIGGDREDMVEIIVDPLLLESYGLDQNDIFTLVDRNNRLVPAGTMDTGKGRFAVKVPSVFESVKDLLELPIKAEGDKVITFEDVSTVRRAYKDPSTFARLNGERSISLEVKKRSGENIINTVNNVKQLIAEKQQLWPQQVVVDYVGDQSVDVKDTLSDLQNNVLSAVLLVVIVVIAALGARTALLVGLAIPGAFLTGILVLAISGLTVNIVVLFGLIMAVGMLVDGAIVVTEFADREMSEGKSKQAAYANAAKRMAWPIIASTATTLAAFAPLMFWPGMMGEFMKYLPITLIAVLTASLAMALIFVPTLGTVLGKPRPMSDEQKQQVLDSEKGDFSQLTGFTAKYIGLLSKAIKHPWKVIMSTIVMSVVVMFLYGASELGVVFFPEVEPNSATIVVRSHGDLSVYEKDAIMRDIEQRILPIEGIDTLYNLTGGNDIVGTFQVNFLNWQLRRKADEIIENIQKNTADMAGVELEARKNEDGPQSGKDVVIELSSRFPEQLEQAVKAIRGVLVTSGKFTDLEDTAPKPGIEWQLNIDRKKAATYGADAALVGSTVQMVTNGLKLGEYRPDDVDDELDIRVRFPQEKRSIGRLDSLRIKTSAGLVPVSSFVERVAAPKVDTIRRTDGKRVVTIQANLITGAQLLKELPVLQAKLPTLGIAPTVHIELKGQNEDQQESQAFLVNAFGVALFVMAIILVTQFNSFYQAFLILSAVVFSTVGVFLALVLVQKPFGIVMGGIGVISLAGIVVNNNIVLIDTYNVLRSRGMSATDAVLSTGAQRLRPVMLTTITTILGLLPMVMQVNLDFFNRTAVYGAPSTQWWTQLATVVAGGLAFATILTLVLTPCLLMLRTKKGVYQSAKQKMSLFTRNKREKNAA